MALNVELQVFDGPLDLLLHLIEKNKINIFDIPIVEITEQYLAYVRQMETEDLGVMSEFMVMAAELIAIKCKMLLPAEVDEEGEEIDPRSELVRQLLEYKMYKYMSYELRDQQADAARMIFKRDTTPKEVLSYRPKADPVELLQGVDLSSLHQIFEDVLRRQSDKIDPIRSQFGRIEKEEVNLTDKLGQVMNYAKKKKRFSFRDLLMEQKTRMQTIVTFLAMLELMKYGVIEVRQETIEGEIEIEAVDGAELNVIDIDADYDAPQALTSETEEGVGNEQTD